MPVTHFIIHSIQKTDDQTAANCHLAETELALERFAPSILSELKRIQGSRSGRQYGCFSQEIMGIRPLITQWREGSLGFSSLTAQLTKHLGLQLDKGNELLQGYIVFVSETLERGDRLFIFHLRPSSALQLSQDLSLQETDYIEFSETGFGICLDLSALENNEDKYLTISFGRGEKGIKAVVCEWLGYTDTVDKKVETEQFLSIIEQYCNALPEDESEPIRERVVEYCLEQDKAGEAVVFSNLSEEVSPGIDEFLTKHQETPKKELIPDRKQLKQYLRFAGKNSDISISFASSSLGNIVEFDPNQEVLMIKNLPKSLLQQLKKLHGN